MHKAHETYKLASEMASKVLPPTHPTRLGVALNFSVFYNEIMKKPEKACDLAKEVHNFTIYVCVIIVLYIMYVNM